MTIQWLSSKRVEGDDADKNTIPVNSLESGYSFTALDTPVEYIWNGVDTWVQIGGGIPVIVNAGWRELGRDTLVGEGDVLSVSSLDNKKYYMVLVDAKNSGAIDMNLTMNADGGTNYANRRSLDGATDVASTGLTQIQFSNAPTNVNKFSVQHHSNRNTKEKLGIIHAVNEGGAGAAIAPQRARTVTKWANTTNAINEFTVTNGFGGGYAVGSEMVVLGWDPTDGDGINFWKILSSEASDNAAAIIQTTFEPKKYLWVQIYLGDASSLPTNIQLTWNDVNTGNLYANRNATNGASDALAASQNRAQIIPASTSPHFINLFVLNQGNEKLVSGETVGDMTAGASTSPQRTEHVHKFVSTPLISSMQLQLDGVETFEKYRVKVWGSD